MSTRTVVVIVEIEGEANVIAKPDPYPPKYQEKKPDIVCETIRAVLTQHVRYDAYDAHGAEIRVTSVCIYDEDEAREVLYPPDSCDFDEPGN